MEPGPGLVCIRAAKANWPRSTFFHCIFVLACFAPVCCFILPVPARHLVQSELLRRLHRAVVNATVIGRNWLASILQGWPMIRWLNRRPASDIIRLAVVFLLGRATCHAEDWPQFRGPNGSGVSASKQSLPEKFSTTENKIWATPVGDGIASPVVASGRLFTTAMNGERVLRVLAFDADSGKQSWYRDFPLNDLPPITPPNSQASSTPCADAERVYLYVTTRGLVAQIGRAHV